MGRLALQRWKPSRLALFYPSSACLSVVRSRRIRPFGLCIYTYSVVICTRI
jgi:hypothetical protein